MGIFDIFGKTSRKPTLQEILYENAPSNRITIPREQMLNLANQRAAQDIRIINESKTIIQTTVKPDVFFSRLNLLRDKIDDLVMLSPYIKIKGVSQHQLKQSYENDREEIINGFIDRYYKSVKKKADTLKTQKAKDNQYNKFFDTLEKYQPELSDGNRVKIGYIRVKVERQTE